MPPPVPLRTRRGKPGGAPTRPAARAGLPQIGRCASSGGGGEGRGGSWVAVVASVASRVPPTRPAARAGLPQIGRCAPSWGGGAGRGGLVGCHRRECGFACAPHPSRCPGRPPPNRTLRVLRGRRRGAWGLVGGRLLMASRCLCVFACAPHPSRCAGRPPPNRALRALRGRRSGAWGARGLPSSRVWLRVCPPPVPLRGPASPNRTLRVLRGEASPHPSRCAGRPPPNRTLRVLRGRRRGGGEGRGRWQATGAVAWR